jgi:DNA modification methylase
MPHKKPTKEIEMQYTEFLRNKHHRPHMTGFEVSKDAINPILFDFQNAAVRWGLRLGKAAMFEDAGMGKTIQQVEWAHHVVLHTGKPVLILSPLAVAQQTIREAKTMLGYELTFLHDESEYNGVGIYISNYERLEKLPTHLFSGIVLDESSILKGADSKTKNRLIETFAKTPYKLCCSATPAPNDYMEFGRHSEFLNIMPEVEMLTRWFKHDSANTKTWLLKGHAQKDFWRWITSWALCISKPRDLGDNYHIEGYDLPELHIRYEWVGTSDDTIQRAWKEGKLMAGASASATDIHKVKRESIPLRLERTMQLINSIPEHEPILVWCETNYEADALIEALKPLGAVELRGNETIEKKEQKLVDFTFGKTRIFITKPSIAGMGLNWQHCNQVIFFSPSFSFEGEYQAMRRTWRFGQEREVFCYMVISETESNIADIVARKRREFENMQKKMSAAMREHGLFRDEKREALTMAKRDDVESKNYKMMLGDCIERMADIADESVHLSVFSPPFASLYTYSAMEADMGNCADDEEFIQHFAYLVKELYRVTVSGRNVAIHIQDLPVFKGKDGYVGMKDFSGAVIRAMTEFDKPQLEQFETIAEYKAALADWKAQAPKWIFHSRITIWKNPVVEMQRTKAVGLLHKQFVKDSVMTRVGNPDYIIVFRKNGDNPIPVTKNLGWGDYIGNDELIESSMSNPSIDIWQRYASPVWMDINQTDTLNYEIARVSDDEKHLCALQLPVIERLIQWYSNEGETVLDPFSGIGSTPHSAVKMKRYGLGIELKPEYFKWAVKNCQDAERVASQKTLWDFAEEQAQ